MDLDKAKGFKEFKQIHKKYECNNKFNKCSRWEPICSKCLQDFRIKNQIQNKERMCLEKKMATTNPKITRPHKLELLAAKINKTRETKSAM